MSYIRDRVKAVLIFTLLKASPQMEVYKFLDIMAQSVSHNVMYYIAKNLFKKANIMLNKKCI